MKTFTPNDKILKILANFATIHPSMLIEPEHLSVINGNVRSIVAKYKFDEPYDFEPFGFYDTSDALCIIKPCKSPQLRYTTNISIL
jgi:hypothetical protein